MLNDGKATTSRMGVAQGHLEYCASDSQRKIIQMRLDGATLKEIAEATGREETNISRTVKDIIFKAARRGYDPEHELDTGLVEGQRLKGVTNLYRFENGERVLSAQYVLGRSPDSGDDLREIAQAIENAAQSVKSLPPVKAPKRCKKDLLNLLHVTDYHLAAYCAKEEGGDDWDMKIAQKTFEQAICELLDAAPDAETGVFSQGGDFLHYDSLEALTPASGHILDADGRAFKMVEIALQLHVYAVERMLEKHRKVVVIIQEGNHDPMSSIWLRKTLGVLFKRNKRVEIVDTEFPYYAYLHGKIMLGFHHGHKKKNKELPALFASEPRYREMWGKSNYCYIHTGHFHQREQDQAEYGGAVVERHPTLAARDAYAARGGWVSWRTMNCITYHCEKGEIARRTTVP